MGWIAKLFRAASKEELNGLRLDHSSWNWAVGETKDLRRVLNSLHYIVGEDAVIFLEGCNAKGEMKLFIDEVAIPEIEHIARGTVWPKQNVIHLPATKKIVQRFSNLVDGVSPFNVATHFHVYENGEVVLEWHDAFTNCIFISKNVSEEKVKCFSKALNVTYEIEGEPGH